jgi:hypothetical protein
MKTTWTEIRAGLLLWKCEIYSSKEGNGNRSSIQNLNLFISLIFPGLSIKIMYLLTQQKLLISIEDMF